MSDKVLLTGKEISYLSLSLSPLDFSDVSEFEEVLIDWMKECNEKGERITTPIKSDFNLSYE